MSLWYPEVVGTPVMTVSSRARSMRLMACGGREGEGEGEGQGGGK